MTYTKEQLIEEAKQAVEGCRRLLRVSPGVEAHKISLRLAEITLASLTAEPVAWIVHARSGDQLTADGDYVANAEGMGGIGSTPLYRTAPPAPVSVPDVLAGKSFEYIANKFQVSISEAQWILVGWSAYRDAMLQGATGNSPAIPDGYALVPVELTGAMTNAMTDAILDDLHNVDVWRSVLAAAPQQEAK